jgi:hypothetical protein
VAALTAYEGGTAGTAGIVSNGVVIPADGSGSFDVYISDPAWVIIDVNGYYLSPSALALGAGLAAAPSLTFGADNTTGLYSSGAGTVSVATGGINRLTVRSDGDVEMPGNIRKSGTLFLHNLGTNNTALGLVANPPGFGAGNTAIGSGAIGNAINGNFNTAVGMFALNNNNHGNSNTAVGVNALANVATGVNNSALGSFAGLYITGDYNIAIGSNTVGAAGESAVIRIGSAPYQTTAYIAGIYGVTTGQPSASPVVIDGNGQLGTVASSIRYKQEIQDMGDASSDLLRLRPVTFRYKKPYADGSRPLDYGLIAEEVAEVYPDLASRNAEGQLETVQYHKLIPMLLNELKKQHDQIANQAAENADLKERLMLLEAIHKK